MAIESNQVSKNTVLAEDSNPFPNIPHEMIVEILLRLPVQTLLRFTRVCKSWRSLISDPKFAKTHISIASSNTDYTTHHRILLRNDKDPRDFKSCSIYSIMHEQPDTTAVGHDCPFHKSHIGVKILCSCNGLVCVAFRSRELCLWNPSTGKSRILPSIEVPWLLPGIKVPWDRYTVDKLFRQAAYGFGYDESIDDYKVVLIFQYLVNRERQKIVVVYTLRTNSWRRIGDCPHPLHVEEFGEIVGKFVSGALHWMGSTVDSKKVIVSLDLAKETFGELKFSTPANLCYRSYLTIDVLGGCLCMFHNAKCSDDLWVMKEYGVGESWTRLFAIPSDKYGKRSAAMCILKNGDVLLNINGSLVQFIPKVKKFCDLMIHRCFGSFTAYPYIGSLVSPYTDADCGV